MRPLTLLILATVAATLSAQPYQPGSVYYGQNGYIEYRAGNLPIIITAPHGGTLTPSEIPDRTCGTTGVDTRTQELIREVEYEIHRRTGRYPHIIICRLSRNKIDVNRDVDEATCGNEAAQPYWIEWHKFIDSAKASVVKNWGKGLYLDLHGHAHAIPRLEWGYLLSAGELAYSDATLNLSSYINESSYRTLATTAVSGSTHAQLLRGQMSLGTLLAAAGVPGVPSADEPSPGADPYFSGGYNTERHGSFFGGTIDGVQLECHSAVRTTHIPRLEFAAKLADGLLAFVKAHYFPLLDSYYSFGSFGSGIPFNAFDTPYSQDFDNIFPGDQSHFYNDNDAGFPGTYTLMTLGGTQPQEYRRYTLGVSTSPNGNIYNAASGTVPADRAVGLLYSSTTGPLAFGMRFVNNTGADIKALTIEYAGEQWRVGGSAGPPASVVANTLEFEYMVAERATNVRTGEYVPVPALNFVSPNTDVAFLQTAVDGNSVTNRRVLTATVNMTIPAGGEVMLRWIDRTDDSGFDHLLAVDDVVVTPRSVETLVAGERAMPGVLKVYPNPSSGGVTIEVPGEGIAELRVWSVASVPVLTRTVEAGVAEIEAGVLRQGIYLVTLSRRGRVESTARLIIIND